MPNIEPTSTRSQSSSTFAGATGATSARAEVEALNARFADAFNAHDAASVADCYTRDAQLMPANSDVVSGRSAIAEFWRGVMDSGIAGVTVESVEVEAQGDLAVDVGRYSLSAADGATLDRGKYMVLLHREGGALRLHRDIWTTSQPAPAAGA